MTSQIQRLRRIALVCLLVAAGLAATATNAFATHFRYGTITWQITDPTHPNVVTIRFDSAFRWSYPWGNAGNCPAGLGSATNACPPVGTVVSPGTLTITGPGVNTNITINLTVTSTNSVEDWFTGSFQTNVTLPATGASSAFYTASFTNSARLSTLAENNHDIAWNVQAGITVPATGASTINQPPTSSTVPIIYLATDQPASFGLPWSDPNPGDVPTFRFSTATESDLNTIAPGTTQGNPMTISAAGLIQWTPHVNGLYAAQFHVQDPAGAYTVVDLLFQVQPATLPAPTVLINGASTAQTINGTAGVPVSFTVAASSNPAGSNRTLVLSAGVVPVGSTMSPALPVSAAGASSTFNWLNPVPNTYVLNFSALDTAGGSQASNSVTLVIGKSPSVTTMFTNVNPSVFGQTVTATATVNPASGSVNPTGTVQFQLDGVNIGSSAAISSHVATATFPISAAAGLHTLTAFYAGDANLASSTGNFSQTINAANTQTVFISPQTPQQVGTAVVFRVQVTPVAPGTGTPSGSVQFFEGPTLLGTGVLSGGLALIAPATLNAGTHLVTAQYSGDSGFNSSTSLPVSQVITKANSTTSVASTVNPSTSGQSVTFTATVNGVPGVAPTGTVQFVIDGVNAGAPVAVVSGVASFTTALTVVSNHSISAQYSGDVNYNQSQGSVTQTVTKATPVVTLTSNVTPSSPYGQPVVFTVTVTTPPGAPPNGQISWSIGNAVVQQNGLAISGQTGTTTLGTNALNVGAIPISVIYHSNNPGNVNDGSASLTQIVDPPSAPPFSQPFPSPAGACICTPVVMNTTGVGSQHWFAKAGGSSMTITAYAVSVNNTDPETVLLQVFDPGGTQMGADVTASYPAGTAPNTEASNSLTFATTPGTAYRVVVSTPGASPLQPHYRLKFDGASEAAMSPINSLESATDKQRWLFNVNAGESLGVRVFPSSFLQGAGANNLSIYVIDTANPSVLVPVLDPSGNPATTVNLATTPLPATFPFTINFATPPSAASVYEVVVAQADGHYRIARFTGADTGIYLGWLTSGTGKINLHVNTSSSFAGPVHVSVSGDAGEGGDEEDLPLGLTTIDEASVGHYHLVFTVPAGYSVTPSSLDIDVLCDNLLDIVLTVKPLTTTTTVTAPAITYGGTGVVTVSVASEQGAVPGSADLTVDGVAPQTQPLSGGSAVFSVSGLSAGDHLIAVTYSPQDGYLASSQTVTLHVNKATPVVAVTGYNVTYNGVAHTATGTVTGVLGENLGGLDLSATSHTNVGSTNDAWTFTDVTGNYTDAAGTVSDAITKATATISVVPYSVTYNGASHTATGTALGAQGENLAGLDLSGTTHTNAGTTTDAWTFTDATGNYTNAGGTVSDVIAKATATISVVPYSVTYNGAAHTAAGTALGALGESLVGLDLSGTTHTAAGTTTDAWTFTDATGNYTNATGTVSDVITKATATIAVTPYSVTYNGAPHTATGTALGALGESLAGLDLSGTTHTAAGTTADAWTFTDATGNYTNASGTVSDVIAKAAATIAVTPYSVTYNGAPHTATGTATGVLGESLTGLALGGTTHTNAGTTADAWTFTDATGNYSNATGTVSDAITKAAATIVVTPYSVAYNGAPHTAAGTATGVLGESLTGLNLSATTHTNAGTTSDTWTFADAAGNYAYATGTVSDSITKGAIIVSVNNKSRSHTAPNPVLDGTVTGVLAGDGIVAVYSASTTSVPGTYPIVATLQDPNGKLGNYTVSITNGVLTVLNTAPVAVANAYAAQWNSPLAVAAPGVLTNDTDGDHDPLSAVVVTAAAHGTVTLNAAGGFTYQPNANYTGVDTFTYIAKDGYLNSNVATVTLTVTGSCRADANKHSWHHYGSNDRDDDDHDGDFDADDCKSGTPIANGDWYSMNHDSTLTVPALKSVLKNDGSLAKVAILVDSTDHGTLTLNADGTFVYTPAAGFSGWDTFVYAAQGATGIIGPVATVNIAVRPNLAPDADNDYYGVKRNTTLTVAAASGVLANDSDPNGDAMTAAVVSGPAHGTLTLAADGSLVYKPATNYVGVDSFTYRTRDAYGATDTATVVINVYTNYDDHSHDNHGSHHHDDDNCDHELHRNGHFDGDGCEHDKQHS